MRTPTSPTKTIHNVQILRFIASAMVLFGHVQHEVAEGGSAASSGFRAFEPVYWAGGVDIFFIISGFIMYTLAKDQFGQQGAAATFMTRRLVRIAPLYWLFTAAMIAATLTFSAYIQHTDISIGNLIASYFFIPYLNPYEKFYPVFMAGWTLNFEMLFYSIFAFGLLLPKRLGLPLIVGIVGALALLGFAARPTTGPFAFWCDTIVLEFLLGMLLAHFRFGKFRFPLWGGLLLCGLAIALMVAAKATGIAGQFWVWRFVWMGVPAFLFCAGLALAHEPDSVSRLKKALTLGGDASYALYLSHPFSINLTAVAMKTMGMESPWIYIASAIAVSLCVAVAVHLIIERPCTRYLNKVVSQSHPQLSPSAA